MHLQALPPKAGVTIGADATARSSVLIVVAVVDDAVLGPSGLFTLTGCISYQLVRVGPTA